MWIDGFEGPGTGLKADGADAGDANPVDYSTTSDDDILGGGAGDDPDVDDEGDDDPAAGADAGAEEGAEADADAEDGEGQDGDEEGAEAAAAAAAAAGKDKDKLTDQPLTAVQVPEVLKPVFKAHPELRTAWYAEKAYREVIPTVAEARQYREIAPTLEDLKYIQSNAQELEALDDLYFSTNEQDTHTFIQGLHKEDPQAFERLAAAFPAALYKLHPEAYRTDTANRFKATFDNLERNAGTDQNLKNAIAVLKNRLKLAGPAAGAAPDPREADILRREQALRDNQTQEETRKFQDFHTTTNDTAVEEICGLIKADLEVLLKNSTATPKARDRMVGDVYNEINATLKGSRDLRQTLRRAFRDGKLDTEHQKRVVALVVGRGKSLLRAASQKVVNEWTNDVLASNKTRLDNKRRVASKVDVTGAGGGGKGKPNKGPVRAADVDYRKTSDDDILEGRVTARTRK